MTENKKVIVIVRIRGQTKIRSDIKDTLTMLNLDKKHSMIVRDTTPSILGMVKKVKDYVTYGIVDADAVKDYPKGEQVHLHPPRGGYERKGTKRNYSIGGALGNRDENILKLIEKMKVE